MLAFTRPRKLRNRYGDKRIVWYTLDRRFKIVQSDGIAGIALPVHYHAIELLPDGERLISRHRKRGAAMRAVARAAQPQRKKVRR
jgi:hypothetical protein